MAKFSQRSLERLSTCTLEVQHLMGEVIQEVDCTVLCGFRGKEDQDEAVRLGRSRLSWPHSKHNQTPSPAVDVVPYPVDWTDPARFARFAGRIESVAHRLGYTVVWGGDWDKDTFTKDEKFVDMPHFEIYSKEIAHVSES